jgi:thiol:disulfide interchange protein DsbD
VSVFEAADRQKFEPGAAPATATAAAPATAAAATEKSPSAASAANTWAAAIAEMPDEQEVAAITSRGYKPYNKEEYPLTTIILFALLGGIILNIMPCVLPVIPLKVLSLVQQAHGDRRLAFLHGLTFTAGVISLFIALAIVIKTAGLFYGQQFQSPQFLIVMVLFVTALALSMLGVWTLNPPQALYAAEGKAPHTGYMGSFTNGLMATLLATPCSAPYLGSVLAWAIPQPAWITVLALSLVGFGMSLPYLILAVFPQALERIPRAGRWSDLLKQGLGIVMLGVAVYLVTLIPNVNYWSWTLLAAVLVAMVCWAWGQIPTYNMEPAKIWTIRIVSLVIGAGLGVGMYLLAVQTTVTTPQAQGVDQHGWIPFNVAYLDEALKQNRPVVIDWTASWCINCRALEATVLNTEEVMKAFADSNVVLLKADLSTDNPPATELNRQLGGEAIPVLAIFSPARPNTPVVLRDFYSRATVVDEVRKANVR